MGKRYSFSLFKCLQKYLSATGGEEAYSNQAFFCSELVATAYIVMGILTNRYSPARYFPVDFSSQQQVEWAAGARLDFEYIIDMSSSKW